LPTFIARVEFRMEAERLEDGGRRLRELAKAASGVGFELERGRIKPAPVAEDADRGGWNGYAPITE
jgi:hypothetical protein